MSDVVSYSAPKKIYSAEFSDCSDAQIIVISAGLPQKEGQTRLELLNSNLNLIKEIVENVAEQKAQNEAMEDNSKVKATIY